MTRPDGPHNLSTAATKAEMERLLAEDVPYGDLTTDALDIGSASGEMLLSSRDAMVLALVEDAAAMIELTGCRVTLHVRSGTPIEPGTKILTASGSAGGLLRSWKVAQTLIECWSGVATAARAIVDAARAVAPGIAVACTRKNTPGTKTFAVAAVRAGGAVMHRLGLSETVLVFPEHRQFLGDEPLADTVGLCHVRAAPRRRCQLYRAGGRPRSGAVVARPTERSAYRAGKLIARNGELLSGRNATDRR
jgi:molybdenum transport protein